LIATIALELWNIVSIGVVRGPRGLATLITSAAVPILVAVEFVGANLFIVVSLEHRDPLAQLWRREDQGPPVPAPTKKADGVHSALALSTSSDRW
jgi:hypothetical protein